MKTAGLGDRRSIRYRTGGTGQFIAAATLKFKVGIGAFPMSDSARYARMSDPDLNRRWSEPANVPLVRHREPTTSRLDNLRLAANSLFAPASGRKVIR